MSARFWPNGTTMEQRKEAGGYIYRIRNRAKAAYAINYYHFLTGAWTTEPERGELSLMGAQAVRLALGEIFQGGR